jgi:hypothetical protein
MQLKLRQLVPKSTGEWAMGMEIGNGMNKFKGSGGCAMWTQVGDKESSDITGRKIITGYIKSKIKLNRNQSADHTTLSTKVSCSNSLPGIPWPTTTRKILLHALALSTQGLVSSKHIVVSDYRSMLLLNLVGPSPYRRRTR